MTINYGELKRGTSIELEGEPYSVVEYEHSKMQGRGPVMKIRFRSLRTGKILDKTFQGDVKFSLAQVERRRVQYIYKDDLLLYFMDEETFEQFSLSESQIEDKLPYLVEQIEIDAVFFNDEAISVDLPVSVDIEIIDTEPGFKGDTAQGGTKPAKLITGLMVQVPLFIAKGDMVKIDTRSGEYLSRV